MIVYGHLTLFALFAKLIDVQKEVEVGILGSKGTVPFYSFPNM